VTGGTAAKVKINGKEAAVIGSMVTTCNDTGARNNSTIIAPGASIPMPVIINPDNMGEYERERAEQETRHPEFTTVKWGKGKVKEGEEAELLAQVKDIGDGNPVTFQRWKEGQDPAVNIAQGQIVKAVEGGAAKAVFSYRLPSGEQLPAADPKWYFTAHSAWCPWKKSGMITVELLRPELSGAKWQDGDGKDTGKGLAGEKLKLSVSCNEDMEEGAGVTFRVYAEGADPARDEAAAELAGVNKGGTAEVEWTYRYKHDPENPLKEKPKYFFTANGNRCKEAKSGNVEIGMNYKILLQSENGEILKNTHFKAQLSDKTSEEGTSTDEGWIELKEKVPGILLTAEFENKDGEIEEIPVSIYADGDTNE
jgi:hypothetical protein